MRFAAISAGNTVRASSGPKPGPQTQTLRRSSCSSVAMSASLTSSPGSPDAIGLGGAARGDRHHAGAGAPGGFGGKPGGAGHGGAADDGDVAAGVFV